MNSLSKEAAYAYINLTNIGYNNFLITGETYLERLYILKQICDTTDKEFISDLNLCISYFSEWKIFDKGEILHFYPLDENNENGENQHDDSSDFHGSDFDPLLHLITDKGGKIGRWEFHKTDSDFYPSIPHGHSLSNHKIKLDTYSGYIYKNDTVKPINREYRRYIINLWNDAKFREAARETIIYYMDNFGDYRWPVKNPLLLPRKRYWALPR